MGVSMTSVEILQSVQFVVNREGRPTAAVLDIAAWEALVSILEDAEDVKVVRERLKDWRRKRAWTRWEDFEAELGPNALSPVD